MKPIASATAVLLCASLLPGCTSASIVTIAEDSVQLRQSLFTESDSIPKEAARACALYDREAYFVSRRLVEDEFIHLYACRPRSAVVPIELDIEKIEQED